MNMNQMVYCQVRVSLTKHGTLVRGVLHLRMVASFGFAAQTVSFSLSQAQKLCCVELLLLCHGADI